MIQPRELSPGNYLMYKTEDTSTICFVSETSLAGWSCRHLDGTLIGMNALHDYEPMPVTGKILLLLGFKKLGKDTFYLGKLKIHQRKKGFFIAKRYKQITYVHQIQNITRDLINKRIQI